MNLFDVSLKLIRVNEIRGHAYDVDANSRFEARFKSIIKSEHENCILGNDIQAELSLEASMPDAPEAFFVISVIGTFEITSQEAIDELSSPAGSYQLGTLMFPYLRSLAKPIIEHLSAADIDFPFSMPTPPAPPKASEAKKPAKPKKSKPE